MKNRIIYIISYFLFCCLILVSCGNEEKYKAIEIENTVNVSEGIIKRFLFESQYVDARNIDVWLPKDYKTDKKYAVLYMNDGQMLFDATDSWNSNEWMVDETISRLINKDSIQDVIVVGIFNNGNKRHTEYFPQKAIEYIDEPQKSNFLSLMPEGPIADNYLKFVVNELKPFIDKTFSTYSAQDYTFIGGSSMGGLISFYALCEYPDVFGGAMCMSTHWIGGYDHNKEIPKALNQYLTEKLPSPEKHKIYFDYGTVGLDANYPEFQEIVDETMKTKNYKSDHWITLKFEGDDHNEKCWAARLSQPLTFLLEKRK